MFGRLKLKIISISRYHCFFAEWKPVVNGYSSLANTVGLRNCLNCNRQQCHVSIPENRTCISGLKPGPENMNLVGLPHHRDVLECLSVAAISWKCELSLYFVKGSCKSTLHIFASTSHQVMLALEVGI